MDLDEIMNPLHDVPGFHASLVRLIPAQRKPRRERLNLEEDIPQVVTGVRPMKLSFKILTSEVINNI